MVNGRQIMHRPIILRSVFFFLRTVLWLQFFEFTSFTLQLVIQYLYVKCELRSLLRRWLILLLPLLEFILLMVLLVIFCSLPVSSQWGC